MALTPELGTQSAVAAKSGLAQSTVGRIIKGQVSVHGTNLQKLALAFGVTTDQLLQDHESAFWLRDARNRRNQPHYNKAAPAVIPVSGDLYIKIEDEEGLEDSQSSIELREASNGGVLVDFSVNDGYALRVCTGVPEALYAETFLVIERQGMPAAWDLCLVHMMNGSRHLLRYIDTENEQHLFHVARTNRPRWLRRSQVVSMHGVVGILSSRQWRPNLPDPEKTT